MRLAHLDRFALQLGRGKGEGIEGADAPADGLSRLLPVDRRLGLEDLFGVGDALGGLLDPVERLGRFQRLDDELGAHGREPLKERLRGVGFGDGRGGLDDHGAGVQAGFHLHERDAGFGVSGLNGALHGRGPAPARQQRAVNVHALDVASATDAAGGIKGPLRQDQAVGGYDQHVGPGVFQRRERFFGLLRGALNGKRDGRERGNAVRERHFLDGARLEFHAAAARAVGLSQNKTNLVPGLKQGGQGLSGKRRGAGKRNTHRTQREKSRRNRVDARYCSGWPATAEYNLGRRPQRPAAPLPLVG